MSKNKLVNVFGTCILLLFTASCLSGENKENISLRDEVIAYHISRHNQNNLLMLLTYYDISSTSGFDAISVSETGSMTIARGITGVFSHQIVSGMLLPEEKEKILIFISLIQSPKEYKSRIDEGYFVTISLGEQNNFAVKNFSNEAKLTKDICGIFDIAASLYQREERLDPPQCPWQ